MRRKDFPNNPFAAIESCLLRFLLTVAARQEVVLLAQVPHQDGPFLRSLDQRHRPLKVVERLLRMPRVEFPRHEFRDLSRTERLGEPPARQGEREVQPFLPVNLSERTGVLDNVIHLLRSPVESESVAFRIQQEGQGHGKRHGAVKERRLHVLNPVEGRLVDKSPPKGKVHRIDLVVDP